MGHGTPTTNYTKYLNHYNMTTPARYCCTLQQSKRLMELGVDAPSMLSHISCNGEYQSTFSTDKISLGTAEHDIYPAYTVGELGEMLPEWIERNEKEYRLHRWRNVEEQYEDCDMFLPHKLGFMLAYIVQDGSTMDRFPQIDSKDEICRSTEAIARAAMLIYLLENNIITPSQVNNQLK